MKKIIIIIIIVIVVWAFIRFVIGGSEDTWMCVDGEWVKHGVPSAPKPTKPCGEEKIDSFQDCINAGYPVMESYPRQCRTPDDKTFVEDIGNELEKIDLIRVDNPRPNQEVSSPLKIKGEARGSWFFEADFPVELIDDQGNLLATAIAQSQGEWMTEDFVAFEAQIEFDVSEETNATFIFKKDNPSGLPEHDDELRMPISLIL